MGKSQRNKGATYEREVASKLSAALGTDVKRRIGQSRDGGHDLDGTGRLVVECKRRKTLTTVESWMKQAEAAAEIVDGGLPIVIAREDNGTDLVIMRLTTFTEQFGDEAKKLL